MSLYKGLGLIIRKKIKTQMKTMKRFILIILIAGVSALLGKAQTYKMQRVQMQTRWAKEVGPIHTQDLYPRPHLQRTKWQNYNGLWDYAITEKDADRPTKMNGKILVPYPIESALSGVKKPLLPDQNLWYHRTISKPKYKTGEKVILHFGAVDWQATVYVNGTEIGGHRGGYTAFSFDITRMLKNGPNDIDVKVFDPTNQGVGPHGKQTLNPANIYYTSSSGIWQTVWLEVVPEVHIEGLVITPDVDKGVINLMVNSNLKSGKFTAIVQSESGALKQVQGNVGVNIAIPIKDAKLWSPDDPFLYDLEVTLGKDKVKSYFGMRKIAIQKDEKGVDRIFLNNKYTFNLGTLDQGFWPDGLSTAPTDEALQFDIKAIKAMGFNTIRKHIKVEPARWYYYADKLGVMVWQDLVNPNQFLPEGGKEAFEEQGVEMLTQLHNYPSITTWVLFNEKWGQYDQARLTKWLKDKDPSRIVNGHSGEYLYVNKELRSPSPDAYINADMTDVHSYPNPMLSIKQKGKAQVCGEFGGVGVPVPGHQWDDLTGWGYIQVSPKELDAKYSSMVDQLVQMEKEGLSASIYTQPFDVEGEENGLMTYDREIIKIPVKRLREIHVKLINLGSKGFRLEPNFKIAEDIDPNDTDDRYSELIVQFEKGKRDSAFLRRLVLMARRKQDQSSVTKYSKAYISHLKQLYSIENLKFIAGITKSSQDPGFQMFLNESARINNVFGRNVSESKTRTIIGKEEIEPYLKGPNANPDWNNIEKTVIDKYGAIGEEKVNGARMVWASEKGDWKTFGKYYALYFKTALTRSEYHINNISWTVFEKIDDPEILAIAVNVTKYNMDTFAKNDPNDIDTYANLLYKAGQKDEAIQWEQKAVELSNNGKEFQETMRKMLAGLPTWPEKNNKYIK